MPNEVISAIIGGLFGGMLTFFAGNHSNKLTHVTKERRDWRDKLRKLVDELHRAKTKIEVLRIRAQFEVRLNPSDPEDKKLLTLFDKLYNEYPEKFKKKSESITKSDYLKNITDAVAKLLKYDWERAKREASFFNIHPIKLVLLFVTGCLFYITWIEHKFDLSFQNVFFAILPFVCTGYIIHKAIEYLKNDLCKCKLLCKLFAIPTRDLIDSKLLNCFNKIFKINRMSLPKKIYKYFWIYVKFQIQHKILFKFIMFTILVTFGFVMLKKHVLFDSYILDDPKKESTTDIKNKSDSSTLLNQKNDLKFSLIENLDFAFYLGERERKIHFKKEKKIEAEIKQKNETTPKDSCIGNFSASDNK